MSDEIIAIVAPLMTPETTIDVALSGARAAECFAVLEPRPGGVFRLYTTEALENAATILGVGTTLSNLWPDQWSRTGQVLHRAGLGSAAEIRCEALGPAVNIAIEEISDAWGMGQAGRVIGFVDEFQTVLKRQKLYQCSKIATCSDKRTYGNGNGTCQQGHRLSEKKP